MKHRTYEYVLKGYLPFNKAKIQNTLSVATFADSFYFKLILLEDFHQLSDKAKNTRNRTLSS